VSAVSVDGGQNQPTGSANGPDAEVMLDIEVAGAVAPGAKIVVYCAPNTDSGFLDAINQAVADKNNNPSVISISWGGPESTWTSQSLQAYNNALQAASAVGISVCVAAGDDGATDGVSDGQDHVDFPASSPYALACGGTHLVGRGSTITDEEVWNDLPSNGATGGGVSQTFPLPTWQAHAKVPPSANPGHFVGRGLPDVAGDADPGTGYKVDVDGSNIVVGATSAVAPLWAGLIACFNSRLKTSLGYLNPTLYQRVASVAGAFRDITSGNNGGYQARPGWDACAGWGSPNGVAILQALVGMLLSPTPTPAPGAPTKKHNLRQDFLAMETKLSRKGQIVLPGAIRRRLGLQPGDLLDVKVHAGRVVLTPRKKRILKGTRLVDPITGLPVLSAGVGAPHLSSKQVREILAEFPTE